MKMPPLTIFGVPVKPTVWDIIDLPSSSAEGDGTVGFGFLKNFNVTVDYKRRRVWLEKWHEPVENEVIGDVGISAGYDKEHRRTVVALVAPKSPAEEAGVKEGDLVLGVGTVDIVSQGFRQMRKLLEGPVDSEVSLALSRGGQLRRVKLRRRALINE
jgi:predicted metalloprotease with PDZ domain